MDEGPQNAGRSVIGRKPKIFGPGGTADLALIGESDVAQGNLLFH